LIETKRVLDDRGLFHKLYHGGLSEAAGKAFVAAEIFSSVSGRGVLRGMHFQLPPHHYTKLVFCLAGQILDVVVDVRPGAGYGRFATFELGEGVSRGLWIPPGCAHGFLSLTAGSIVVYAVSATHHPKHDAGIRWDSFGFDWPVDGPVVSARDRTLPRLEAFTSPFPPA
jgi:dTDP-4-dehydrorhamnose 3,5-epimerase